MLVRSEPIHLQLPQLDAELVLGDLSDKAALTRLCTGANAIIHIAGLIKAKDRSSFFAANADGSESLALTAADVAPSARIVHVSSMAAREPELSDYAASKRAGEEALRKNASGPVTTLRPSAIYGPWDQETLPLFQMAARGRVFAPRAPDARICLIHARDVAEAVVAATQDSDDKKIYELSDVRRDGYSWHEIAKTAERSFGKSPKLMSIPPSVFKLAGLVSEAGASMFGKTPMVTRGKIREILHGDWSSSAEKQPPSELWQPKIDLTQGFAKTSKWYTDQNLL